MRDKVALQSLLLSMDGKGYGVYKSVKGAWSFPDFTLTIDCVQGDPFAAPTRARIQVSPHVNGLSPELYRSTVRSIGVSCYLARAFASEADRSTKRRGSGGSGRIRMATPGQQVIENTAIRISPEGTLEARFEMGLPARGRRVLGREAIDLLLHDLPLIIRRALMVDAHDPEELRRHAEANEDAEALRRALGPEDLVAFVADGARLPRRSGVDDRPLDRQVTTPFRSPPSLRTTLRLPNRGAVTGLGIPRGVTLIVGGGFHGKSTLLRALELGVYNHRPGDGRELVVTECDSVKIRAEDGRSVVGVDVSPFIDGLPGGRESRRFSSPNASGSTSQAAALIEAIESGATSILIDEDTAAANLMTRDRRIQALIPKSHEPITPYIDRIDDIFKYFGISSILVMGGNGDYLDTADTVISMKDFQPVDVTDQARQVARRHPTGRVREASGPIAKPAQRHLHPDSLDPSRGLRKTKIQVPNCGTILFGKETLDLSSVDQLVSREQTRAMAEALLLAYKRFLSTTRPMQKILDEILDLIEAEGLDVLGKRGAGDLAAFRRHELAAALNRLRSLKLAQKP